MNDWPDRNIVIHRNEFDTFDEAMAAAREFPVCGTCNSGVHLNQRAGRFLIQCIRRPDVHNGIRRKKG